MPRMNEWMKERMNAWMNPTYIPKWTTLDLPTANFRRILHYLHWLLIPYFCFLHRKYQPHYIAIWSYDKIVVHTHYYYYTKRQQARTYLYYIYLHTIELSPVKKSRKKRESTRKPRQRSGNPRQPSPKPKSIDYRYINRLSLYQSYQS